VNPVRLKNAPVASREDGTASVSDAALNLQSSFAEAEVLQVKLQEEQAGMKQLVVEMGNSLTVQMRELTQVIHRAVAFHPPGSSPLASRAKTSASPAESSSADEDPAEDAVVFGGSVILNC